MATTYASAKAAAGITRKVEHQGNVSVTASYTIAAALVINDLIQMVKIPKGATILEILLAVPDLDSNVSPAVTLDVGDATTADRFIAANTVGQAGGVARIDQAAGVGYTYTADDVISVKVHAAPATSAITGTITLSVLYTNDL
jgi:hypothetical protein